MRELIDISCACGCYTMYGGGEGDLDIYFYTVDWSFFDVKLWKFTKSAQIWQRCNLLPVASENFDTNFSFSRKILKMVDRLEDLVKGNFWCNIQKCNEMSSWQYKNKMWRTIQFQPKIGVLTLWVKVCVHEAY